MLLQADMRLVRIFKASKASDKAILGEGYNMGLSVYLNIFIFICDTDPSLSRGFVNTLLFPWIAPPPLIVTLVHTYSMFAMDLFA